MSAATALPIEAGLLQRLNRLSLTRSFTPQIDVDWSATTTDEEFAELYPAWSLLEGTGADAALDGRARVLYARYQQMNLMFFTGLLERHAISALAAVYDLDPAQEFSEYVGHFLKEEIYHHMMFQRAVAQLHAAMPEMPPLPSRAVNRAVRRVFALGRCYPSRKMRSTHAFLILRFVEQVTIYANQMTQARLPRRGGLVQQVWAFHALDESRHLQFDQMIIELNRQPAWLDRVQRAVAAACCVLLSLLLNANELWAARRLGLRLRWWHLPRLMRRTRAPFKRRAFALIGRALRGQEDA
jgi:hypothetical protein